jgi:hypothetical protein
MNKGRVGEDRGSKERDQCPLTDSRTYYYHRHSTPPSALTSGALDRLWTHWDRSVDNLNTTQTPECTKEKYNAKIKVKGSLLRSHQQPM